jgi:hypothetical protein
MTPGVRVPINVLPSWSGVEINNSVDTVFSTLGTTQ